MLTDHAPAGVTCICEDSLPVATHLATNLETQMALGFTGYV